MIDFNDLQQAWEISVLRGETVDLYGASRAEYARSKIAYRFKFAEIYGILKTQKPGLGWETAEVMALENKELKPLYETMITEENKCKYLEEKISALAGQMSLIQSMTKHIKQNT
jgi:hypothetical protein